MIRRAWRGERGQTVTEYLMILGILTAIIVALTRMIAPAIARGIIGYLERQVVFVSTVAP
jgi:Flp pilus assembly pilin Flp